MARASSTWTRVQARAAAAKGRATQARLRAERALAVKSSAGSPRPGSDFASLEVGILCEHVSELRRRGRYARVIEVLKLIRELQALERQRKAPATSFPPTRSPLPAAWRPTTRAADPEPVATMPAAAANTSEPDPPELESAPID
jgi:hypothetical protein